MRTKMLNSMLRTAAFAGFLLTSGASFAQTDVYLQAESFQKDVGDGVMVDMWGFASCDATFTTCVLDAPGPQIDIDTSSTDLPLNIHLKNTLSTPVSVVIPGQAGGGDPVMVGGRVQSFTREVAAGADTGGTPYSWSSLNPGTYLYQSGTHPSLQVPMGLYGALTVNVNATESYPGINVTDDAVLLFSEIDPIQNGRVAAASGTPTQGCASMADYLDGVVGYPCTIDYNPMYFLVNGSPTPNLAGFTANQSVLLRLLNAGLRSHTPALVDIEMTLLAEDGNRYPGLPLQQSSALLPAGKTLDALITTPADTDLTLALLDRSPTFSDGNQPNGGAWVTMQVGAGSPPPPVATIYAVNDVRAVTEDTPLIAAATVLGNDAGLGGATVAVVSPPANAQSFTLNADGTFDYTPNDDFSGNDSFTYSAALAGTTYPAQVTLEVSFENDTPVAAADTYVNAIGANITVAAPGILGNDADPDGDALTAVIDGTPPAGLTLNADGSFEYTGGTGTTFSYTAMDDAESSLPVEVTLNINPVAGIALNVQDPLGNPVTEYRWTVEEDTMWQPDPSLPPPAESLATSFHKSYMPVVAQGCVGTGCPQDDIDADPMGDFPGIGDVDYNGNGILDVSTDVPFAQLALDPTKHYYVSVLPADAATGSGHTIGGARIPPGAAAVSVNVNNQPLPDAQISVFVFEDNSPTNGAVDGAETGNGLGSFQITLEEAGGRYGASGGTMLQDANGDLLANSLDCFDAPPPIGIILSCPNTPANIAAGVAGEALIKNLYPGKYGIIVTSPAGDPGTWTQTSTIEGSKVIDAWVKAGEPEFFQEFGPASWHVFVGFVNPDNLVNPGGTNTVTGNVTNMHMSRPPNQVLWDSGSYDALAHTRAWVGLNSAGGIGANIVAVQAESDGSFTIDNVPDGLYQLVVWDSYNDQILAYRGVSLPGGGAVGNMPVFNWFARSEHNVFLDDNENGIRDEGEAPLAEQAILLRWRDGTVNQEFPTDLEGFVPFDQTFPFFNWQVLEVDYTRFKATGLTTTVDAGGDVTGGDYPGLLNPQEQDGGGLTRTETGAILTQGFQGFLGQTSIFDWGKKPYEPGENGGISGIVYYPSTRAENDPRLAAAEPWEPGIPSVKVRLYREVATSTGGTALALVQETETDNWDESLPTGCPGGDATDPVTPIDKCYDGLRNFNQARPAVFDGGYAFNDIPAGKYVVEVVPPPGYELMKEEDNNVGFGDVFANPPVALPPGYGQIPDRAMVLEAKGPKPGLAQPPCVGTVREVPLTLSLFPAAEAEAPFAGALRPLCDRKEVILSDQGQSAADFFLFTGAPISGHIVGMILDDLAQEFDVNSPSFGEKWAPPYVPVSIRDHNGKEISRIVSDQWGRINGLVPSTFSANAPSPSGFSPAMHITCMNDPGPIPGPGGTMIIDPQYNPAYSNFCYTLQYMPGTTTYLDTPVLPVSAFASGYNAPYCSLDQGTPMIHQVDGTGTGPLVAAGGTLTISSRGTGVEVPNPAYEGPGATGVAAQKTILRDFGFGDSQGLVTVGGTALTIATWSADTITATVPLLGVSTGELVVTRDNGNSTVHSATVTVSSETPIRVAAGGSIQDAIDTAAHGDLILVGPGSYSEQVIMWKPVRLQGAGAGSTFINAVTTPTDKIVAWREKMDSLFANDLVDALPNQPTSSNGFETEEGAGITVVAKNDGSWDAVNARIDGFSITGGAIGGGIFVNGYAHNLEIANNHVFGNSGLYAGGIRVGRPFLELTDAELNGEGLFAFNNQVNIHDNAITQNGGLGGAGGGLSIATGTDKYNVSSNFVCGNFTTGDGGGIGHLGLSDKGVIANNRIVLNQSFAQATSRSGGGLFIGGEPSVGGLTYGSGSVTIDANLIQSNQAGAGHGGGIRTQFVNGRDVTAVDKKGRPNLGKWYSVTLNNNMIVNNVAGWSGGGVSMADTAYSFIVNNTIANNDSTATVSATFTTTDPNISVNQPAGITTEPHSPALNAAIPVHNKTDGLRDFSNPTLSNNIVWQNRSFYYDGTLVGGAGLVPVLNQSSVGECASGANYADLGVLGGGFTLNPVSSVLTDTTGYDASNISGDPDLMSPYCNGGRVLLAPGPMLALPAMDEGGATWIDVRFGPLTYAWPDENAPWDYHIGAVSSALDVGSAVDAPTSDFDNDPRPLEVGFDIGADEYALGGPVTQGQVSYSSGAFGDVELGTPTTLTITATVSFLDVTFASSTTPSTPFDMTANTCSGLVSVGGTCTFTVDYTPTAAETSNDSFTVTSDALGSPQLVSLSGTGVTQGTVAFTSAAPYPLDGGTLEFGNLKNGDYESTVTLTIAANPVTFGSLATEGSGRFNILAEDGADTCSGQTVNAGDTCTVTITFNANGGGNQNGTLTAPHDGTGGAQILSLHGR